MGKNKKSNNRVRNMIRILVILFLGMLVSFILCKREASANNRIIQKTANDAFVLQSILLVHNLEPNAPSDYTDISTLEDSNDSDSFVSDMEIKTGASQYYIRVNYGANCVTIYKKDDEGNYTKPYKAMICSTGKATPKSGTYKITYKYRWLSLYGGVYGQYSTRIVKSILFHSVPYFEQRADTLEYEEYDKLGTTASAGCIRLTVQDAKWIYDNITSGTYVEFYSDPTNPGPLGKPKAQKISGNTKNRDWDPTDPDINNPWNGGSGIPSVTYTKPKDTKKSSTNSSKNTQSNKATNTNIKSSVSHENTTNNNKTDSSDDDIYKNTINSQHSSETNNTTSSSSNNQSSYPNDSTPPKENQKENEDSSNPTTPSTNTSKPETTHPSVPKDENEDEDNEKQEQNKPTETTPSDTTPSEPSDNSNDDTSTETESDASET